MGILIKDGGVWKDSDPQVKHNDEWKPVKAGYSKMMGVWKSFYSDGVEWTINPGERSDYVYARGFNDTESFGTVYPAQQVGDYFITVASLYYNDMTGFVSARVLFSGSSPDMTGKVIVINGYTITCNTSTGYSWNYDGTLPIPLPFNICGANPNKYDLWDGNSNLDPFEVIILDP